MFRNFLLPLSLSILGVLYCAKPSQAKAKDITEAESGQILRIFTEQRILMNLRAEKMLSNKELLIMAAESKEIPGDRYIAYLKRNQAAIANKLLEK